jgi:hypothetical protein
MFWKIARRVVECSRSSRAELWNILEARAPNIDSSLDHRCHWTRASQFKPFHRYLEQARLRPCTALSSTKWGSPSAPAPSQFDTARIGGVALGAAHTAAFEASIGGKVGLDWSSYKLVFIGLQASIKGLQG